MSDEESSGEDVLGDLRDLDLNSNEKPVPSQRRVKQTEEEAQILEDLDEAISTADNELRRREPPKRSNRQSVLAAGKLQQTKNMLEIFERMAKAKTSNPSPIPPVRHVAARRSPGATLKPDSSSETENKSDISPTSPKPIPRGRGSSARRQEKEISSDTTTDDVSNDDSQVQTASVNGPIDFINPDVIAELKKFLANGSYESRQLVNKIIESDITAGVFAEELMIREDFVPRMKKAAEVQGIDMTELSFSFVSD